VADVFVSYKAEDRARVRSIVEALQADGLSVWWDAHIGAGEEWREAIAENLDKAKCIVVIWSKRSVGPEGRFVRDEAARAVKRHAYLPVTIDKVEPPLGFGETQCLPLSGWKGNRDDARYLTLLDAARQVVGGQRVARHRTVSATKEGGVDRRLVLAGGAAAGLAAVGGAGWYLLNGSAANASSVAVLPFANLSGDPAQAYFSDGLAEELRSALSRINGLKVIGRTSSEAVKNEDAESAARKLEVASILTGSVRRSASTIRVNAQLVDGKDGAEKWSQTFDRPNGDALQIQADIAEAVVGQLRSKLGGADKAAIALGGTSNSEAQDLVLKAESMAAGSRETYLSQMSLFDAAIALDPDYAAAFAGKSQAQTNIVAYYARSIDDLNTGIAKGAALARKAIALAPQFADGHYALGLNRNNAIDFSEGWKEYSKALASPGIAPDTMVRISYFAVQLGAFDTASRIIDQAAERDPLNPRIGYARAVVLAASRRYAAAIPQFEAYLRKNPDSSGALSNLVSTNIYLGRLEAAETYLQRLPDNHPTVYVGTFLVALKRGKRDEAMAVLNDMRAKVGDPAKYQYAEMLSQFGDHDGAIRELEGAYRLRDPGLGLLPTDELFDPLRSDPRFKAIVAKLNYPVIA
jgi:TolB-like protein/Tfp pilus assembly protein PilF